MLQATANHRVSLAAPTSRNGSLADPPTTNAITPLPTWTPFDWPTRLVRNPKSAFRGTRTSHLKPSGLLNFINAHWHTAGPFTSHVYECVALPIYSRTSTVFLSTPLTFKLAPPKPAETVPRVQKDRVREGWCVGSLWEKALVVFVVDALVSIAHQVCPSSPGILPKYHPSQSQYQVNRPPSLHPPLIITPNLLLNLTLPLLNSHRSADVYQPPLSWFFHIARARGWVVGYEFDSHPNCFVYASIPDVHQFGVPLPS
ncbi:hypothetical protein JAAARDRAFT_196627 [Jaapia argillacea MUCL 33604]|uniref:Uncharacterized protein n=1 Tax=Jaapia argillacea MUCL 33604 TaxID=933084 RepID=A0A067PHG3_9AGAM|nr:hypothetical protein JAAARDRAFT_196627 [Jaapia argillacea MUCL 33604]